MSHHHHRHFVGIKHAWIQGPKLMKVLIDPHVHHEDLQVLDHEGNKIPHQKRRESEIVYLDFSTKLDFSKNFQITLHSESVFAIYTMEMLNSQFFSEEELGASFEGENVLLSLWSPTAIEMNFLLYDKDGKTLLGKAPMKRGTKGVWKGKIKPKDFNLSSLEAYYYQYEVKALGKTVLALDPYAKSMAAFDPHGEDKVGKAALVRIELPKKRKAFKSPCANEADYIGYEAHIHDYTIDPNLEIPEEEKGTYKGFERIIPHLTDLGITHVQFMPLQNFYTTDERNRDFQSIDVPMGRINYNWGYDPHNYFTPEGWYSMNPEDPYARLHELKGLVESLHEAKIGAVLDVVYNHLYHYSLLENAAPACYLRRHDNGVISEGTGAGVSLESRNLMSRRLIIDSLKHYQEYFGFDGFRFDLMGFIDTETMRAIRKALGPKTILYGEAWNFTDLPYEEAPTKSNFPHDIKLGVFNDSSRDAYAGQMSGKGFVQGSFGEIHRVKTGIIGGLIDYPAPYGEMYDDEYNRFAQAPYETINYLAIHDGFTLWDKINLSYGGKKEDRERIVHMALSMLFTSQGNIVLHGGDEIGRSKPLSPNDPNSDRAHSSSVVDPELGVKLFHENTYASPDSTNKVDWRRMRDFTALFEYTKGLIALRRSLPGLRFLKTQSVAKGLKFIGPPNNFVLDLPGDFAHYQSFSELKKLTLQFVGAPQEMRGKRFYLVGEIHGINKDKNPPQNPYSVEIDEKGHGSLEFKASELKNFDYGFWTGKKEEFSFKLVKTYGQWDFPTGVYDEMGSNAVSFHSILKGDVAVIDLSIKNHHASNIPRYPQKFVAYIIDNTLEKDVAQGIKALPYRKILVIHNADDAELVLPIKAVKNTSKWHVLADGKQAGVKALKETEVVIEKGQIRLPRKCSAILGCLE